MSEKNPQVDTNYIYVITRRDLPFPVNAVQSCHAAIEASQAFYDPQTSDHPHLVLTAVRDEQRLCKWISKLEKANIEHKVWYEPDLESITAVATTLVSGEQRRFFRDLQLLT